MRFWENRTVADIARELKEPYSRVAVRLYRLIERLKRRNQMRSGNSQIVNGLRRPCNGHPTTVLRECFHVA